MAMPSQRGSPTRRQPCSASVCWALATCFVATMGSVSHVVAYLDAWYELLGAMVQDVGTSDLFPVLAELDAAVIVGRGSWANAVSHRLASEDLVPVATPRWIHRYEIQNPEDLIGPPLLTHTPRPALWGSWFAENGIDTDALVLSRLSLEQITMILEATLADLGAALLPRLLIRRELEQGELAVLPGKALQASEGFFFVCAGHRETYPPLIEFRDWLLSVF